MKDTSTEPGLAAARVDLTGHSALVTGAVSDRGGAIVQRLAWAGAAVSVLDLTLTRLLPKTH